MVGKARKSVVGEDDITRIDGAREGEVGRDDALRVGGNVQRTYAGHRTTVVGADPKKVGDDVLGVAGRYRVGSVGEMRISSETSIELFCGKSKILITPDSIILDAPTIQLQASDRIALVQGSGAATLTLAGSASLGGGTVACVAGGKDGLLARLFLDTNAHLDGAPLVLLNCGPLGAAAAAGRRGPPSGDGHLRPRQERRSAGHHGADAPHRDADRGGRRASLSRRRQRRDDGLRGRRLHRRRRPGRRGTHSAPSDVGPRPPEDLISEEP